MTGEPKTHSRHAEKIVWLIVIVTVVASLPFLPLQDWLKHSLDRVNALGPWGPVLFIAIYAVATVLLIPGSVLTLGAGAAFGVVKGSIYVSIASTLGASGAFLVGRYLTRDWVAKRIANNPKFAAMNKAVAAEGWKIVGLTRLSPVFPFTLLNYAFGLTTVSFRDYVLFSWLGMMPGTVMYVYLGSLAQAGAGQKSRTPGQWALYGVGLAATIAVTIIITKIAKQALGKRIEANSP